VAKTTTFNGAKLLEGSFTGGVFQVGANSGDNITVGGLGNMKVDSLGNLPMPRAQPRRRVSLQPPLTSRLLSLASKVLSPPSQR
jgi:hypothetical protein